MVPLIPDPYAGMHACAGGRQGRQSLQWRIRPPRAIHNERAPFLRAPEQTAWGSRAPLKHTSSEAPPLDGDSEWAPLGRRKVRVLVGAADCALTALDLQTQHTHCSDLPRA